MSETWLQLPSGRVFSILDMFILSEMAESGFIRYLDKPTVLDSGIESRFYIFGREDLTDNQKLEWLIGEKLNEVIEQNSDSFDSRTRCLIGIPTAGTALAQAAAMVNHYFRVRAIPNERKLWPEVCHRLARQVTKDHGPHKGKWVNGPPDHTRQIYWGIDNAVTSGKELMRYAERIEGDGYQFRQMHYMILVDRQQGAISRLEQAGFQHLTVVYRLLDIVFAYTQMRIWPKETFKAIEEEIRVNQF
jgi:orotate phosphoribosyltransferase